MQPLRTIVIAGALATWGAGLPAQAAAPPLGGDHRLLDAFIEDGALVSKAWFEAQGSAASYGDGHDVGGALVAAFRYGRDVEAGVRVGLLHRGREAGADLYGSTVSESFSTTGADDLTIYGKYRVLRSPFDLAVGASLDLPLADQDSGLTSGAVQAAGFAALRARLGAGVALVGHAGVAVSGDARYGAGATGRTVAVAGIGTLVPLTRLWTLLGEVTSEGARFDGAGTTSRMLVGLDWRPAESIAARGGLAAGLSDAAPNLAGVLSFVFHF